MKIILASQSPRRKELLERMGIREFEVIPAQGEEEVLKTRTLTPEQLVEQLYKLPVVTAVEDMEPEESVCRELLLIKMENDPSSRSDILAAVEAYEAKSVDYTRDSIVIQLTGDTRRIDTFINLMRDYHILEICRTGVVALERGSRTIRDEIS